MAQDNPYEQVLVESYLATSTAGKHGKVHIRPVAGHKYPSSIQVECSKKLSRDFPVGTQFSLKAKLTDREGSGAYLYSHPRWKFEIVKDIS